MIAVIAPLCVSLCFSSDSEEESFEYESSLMIVVIASLCVFNSGSQEESCEYESSLLIANRAFCVIDSCETLCAPIGGPVVD